MIVLYQQIFFNDREAAARKVNRKSDVVSSGDLLHPAIVNSQWEIDINQFTIIFLFIPSDHYVVNIAWASETAVIVTWLNRDQNEAIIHMCDLQQTSSYLRSICKQVIFKHLSDAINFFCVAWLLTFERFHLKQIHCFLKVNTWYLKSLFCPFFHACLFLTQFEIVFFSSKIIFRHFCYVFKGKKMLKNVFNWCEMVF